MCAPSQWYAHQGTTVWLVTGGADRVKGLTYWDKGWTSFEFALAMLIKPANTSTLKDWPQVVDLGKEGDAQTAFARPALSEPLAFFGGHEYGDKTYTNGADRDAIVAPKFRETMFEVMGGVGELNFGKLKWGNAEIKALAVVLPLCGRLTKLQVHGNAFGDASMVELAGAMGALDNLAVLHLLRNQITDDGFATLMPFLKKGGKLSNLTEFSIGSGITDKGMTEFADILSMGALPALEQLELTSNQIGDDGLSELASACASGALDHLTVCWRPTALFPCLETWHTHPSD